MNLNRKYLSMIVLFVSIKILAQQDPNFTQYIYNTQTINPAYVGNSGGAVLNLLVRSQWLGVEGAPQTQVLSYDTPLGNRGVGLGVNLINDKIGPVNETSFDISTSYTIDLDEKTKLSLGLSLGGNIFNVDWSKIKLRDAGDVLSSSSINKFLPRFGSGLYLFQTDWYLGVSVPNFIKSDYYDAKVENNTEIAREQMHIYFIGAYVFNLNENVKFKPAALMRAVGGAPLSFDLSANFLIKDKVTAGLSWRVDDALGALLSFKVTDNLHLGYAYDLTTTNFSNYNSGTHELMLRYEAFKKETTTTYSPKFF